MDARPMSLDRPDVLQEQYAALVEARRDPRPDPVMSRWRRAQGGILAALLSLGLAALGVAMNDMLLGLGLFGAPIVLVLGAWLTPLAMRDGVMATLGIGLLAAVVGEVVVCAGAALGPTPGFGDPWRSFVGLLILGLPFALLTAIVITLPMGALWVWIVRRWMRGSER